MIRVSRIVCIGTAKGSYALIPPPIVSKPVDQKQKKKGRGVSFDSADISSRSAGLTNATADLAFCL
jgi:hypothetical protein